MTTTIFIIMLLIMAALGGIAVGVAAVVFYELLRWARKHK